MDIWLEALAFVYLVSSASLSNRLEYDLPVAVAYAVFTEYKKTLLGLDIDDLHVDLGIDTRVAFYLDSTL